MRYHIHRGIGRFLEDTTHGFLGIVLSSLLPRPYWVSLPLLPVCPGKGGKLGDGH